VKGVEFLLGKINYLQPRIKFTLEVQENNKLNVLDLTISNLSNKLEFGIFRKPSQTDHTIPEVLIIILNIRWPLIRCL